VAIPIILNKRINYNLERELLFTDRLQQMVIAGQKALPEPEIQTDNSIGQNTSTKGDD